MTDAKESGSSVLITGASGGVGRATAIAFANRAFRVGVHFNRGAERADETLSLLAGDGHCRVRGNLAHSAAVRDLFESATAQLGKIDVLVNNAGIGERHTFDDCSYETWNSAWHRIIDTNLIGPANLSYLASKQMARNGGGRIINVSSRGAFVGEPDQPWYGASKAGLNAMGQSLAKALAPRNVLVFAVAPGFVQTPMSASVLDGERGEQIRQAIPLGRVTTAEEVAETIVFLGTVAPPTMTGAILDINGASYLRT